jgi:hypothetical protein
MHDIKVQKLRPELFKFWVNLLCLANERPERGTLPPIEEIAFNLRMKAPVTAGYVASLKSQGLLDETSNGSLTPHNWVGRQPKSDDVSKRVNDYRQRILDNSNHTDETVQNSGCNVTSNVASNKGVTPRVRAEREIERRGDTEGEEKKNPPFPLSGPHSSPFRSADDLAEVNAAIRLLGGELTTEAVGLELGRQHNSTNLVDVPGWKFLRAATKILSPSYTDAQRRSFPYYVGMASKLDDSERNGPAKETRPSFVRESSAQAKQREMEESMRRRQEKRAKDGSK